MRQTQTARYGGRTHDRPRRGGEGRDVTTRKATPDRRASGRRGGGGRRGCPPHGPVMVAASEEGYYSASCLACGVRGPERGDGWEAKLAFDEATRPPPG